MDGLYLEGARVSVLETEQVVFSERGGEYILRGLPPGDFTIDVTYTGFSPLRESITLESSNSVETFNPVFHPVGEEVFELETLVVEGSLLGSAKAIAQSRAAENLVDIVASDAFGQFTDRNPAEALQRLAGVTVQESQGEGQFVIIRGADPRLNSISIDGVFAATPEEDGRRTALNIISIDQLESIEVTKTWLPDQWANFVGGSVNLVTRSALERDERFASLEVAYGQHTIADENSVRVSGVYGDVLKLHEEGDRLLGIQFSIDFSEDNRGSETLSVDRYVTDVPWEIRNMPDGLNFPGYDLEDYEIKRERVGLSTKLEYRHNANHEWALTISHNEFDDDEVLQETSFDIAFNNYGGERFLTESTALALGYDLSDPEVDRRINILGVSNEKRLRADEAFALGDVAFDEEKRLYTFQRFGATSTKRWESTLTVDRLTTIQASGKHRFGENLSLDYRVYGSQAQQERNVQTFQLLAPRRNSESGLADGLPFIRISGDAFADPSIYITEDQNPRVQENLILSDDERFGGEINGRVDYQLRGLKGATQIGIAADYRDKAYDRSFASMSEFAADSPTQELSLATPRILGEPEDDFLSDLGRYDFGARFDTPSMRRFLAHPDETAIFDQNDNDKTASILNDIIRNYQAEEDIVAGYFLQTLEWKRWKLLFGLRHERTRNRFENFNLITRPEEPIGALRFIQPVHWRLVEERLGRDAILEAATFETQSDHTLPAIHLIRRVGEDWIVRLAATKTIRRPTFTDLIPREIPSISGASFGSSIRMPNFDLRALESQNLDLSIDYFFNGIGNVGLSVFYKRLKGPIYEELRVIEPGQEGWESLSEKFDSAFQRDPLTGEISRSSNITWSTTTMANAGDGHLQGLEFSFERDFDFLPAAFRGFGASFNFSLIDSEVSLLRPERNEIRTSSGEIITLDPRVALFQQPDRLANASLYFKRSGFLVRLSYSYRGESLRNVLVSESILEDLVDDIGLPASALDSFDASRERLDLFAQYAWNRSFTIFLEATNLTNEPNRRFDGDRSRPSRIQYTQAVYFLGLQWKL